MYDVAGWKNTATLVTREGVGNVAWSPEGKRLVYTLRLDGKRHRVMRWSEDGVTSVVDGVWTERKFEMPWVSKCS